MASRSVSKEHKVLNNPVKVDENVLSDSLSSSLDEED